MRSSRWIAFPCILILGLGVSGCNLPQAGGTPSPTTETAPSPTVTPTAGPCMIIADSDLAVYQRPSASADVFGTMTAGESYPAGGQTADGWFGFDPGVAQAANIGVFRLRWVQEGTSGLRLEGDCAAVPVVVGPPPGVCFDMPMDTTQVYAAPDLASSVVATMALGDYAAVIGRATSWAQVDLSQGNTGLAVTGWVEEWTINLNGPCEALPIVTVSSPATPTAVPSAGPATLTPRSGDITCRFGPGMEYAPGGTVPAGTVAPILGRNGMGGWWAIDLPRHPGRMCWVSADDATVSGDTAAVPVLPPPYPYVSGVTVAMTPETAMIPCNSFPYTFSVRFTIEVTGPTRVTFQRILSDGHSAPPETVEFLEFGSRTFTDYYRVGGPGTYWFRVTATSPNAVSGEATVTMSCSGP